MLDYNSEVDLAKLQAELGQFIETKQTFTGMVVNKGQVAALKDKIKIKGSSTVTDLVIASADKSASEPSAKINYDFEMDKKQNILNIALLQIEALKLGNINIAKGTLPLNKESAKPTKMDIVANVDLANIQPFAELSPAWPKDLQIAGKAQSKLSVNSSKNIYNINTDSTHIDNLKVQKNGKEPFEQASVDVKFDSTIDVENKNIHIKSFELVSPQIKITQGQFKQRTSKAGITSLAGIAKCQYDWQAVSNISSQFLPEGSQPI